MRDFTHSLRIEAPPAPVLDAFFDPDALAVWWQVKRSLCVARPLGSYAIEWEPTTWRDDVLGRLGGTLRGTVIEFNPGRNFFIADVHWLPPDGQPLGPMALEATCVADGAGTVLHLKQSGWDDSPRWTRYYDVIKSGLTDALANLKQYLEARWEMTA
jgi:uncharacterized protein YndB with AHSA1/START domain